MRLAITKPTHKEAIGYILILIVCAFAVFAAWWDKVLPEAKRGNDSAPDEFAEGRSDAIIKHLAVNIGARVVGHSGPIDATVNFLMSSFQEMNREVGVNENTRVVDLERDYGLSEKDAPKARYYWEYQCPKDDKNLARNVVARLRRQGRALPSPRKPLLLLSAHFDTVGGSPGATDDAFGVALVMETARALLHYMRQVNSPALEHWEVMVALFDGEEAGSKGAYRFMEEYLLTAGKLERPETVVTRHPTMVVLNIEGSGSAVGKSSLLRSLKGSGWLAGFFMRHSRRPYGSSFTQFLFDMLRVGYTDIDTLKQLQNVHAIDMLPLDSRWNYHCPTDSYEHIAQGAQQHAGENYLSVTRQLLASDPAVAIPSNWRDDISRHSYFSFLGLLNVLVMSHGSKNILDVAAVCIFVLSWIFMRRRKGRGFRLMLLRCVGCLVSSLILAVLVLLVVDKFLMRASEHVPLCYLDNPWITFNFIRTATYFVVLTFVSVLFEIPLTLIRLSTVEDDDWEACMGIFLCVPMLLGFFSEFLRELTFISFVSLICICLVWTVDYLLRVYGKEQLLLQLPLIVARQSMLVLPAGFLFADMLQVITGKLPFYTEQPGPMVPITIGLFIGVLFMPLLRLACYGQRSVPSEEAEAAKLRQLESKSMSVGGGLLFAAVLACSCLVGCIVVKTKIPY